MKKIDLKTCDFDEMTLRDWKEVIKSGQSLNIQNENGDTPLYYGATPLYYACSKNNVSLVKLFLEADADVNLKSKYGNTPLHATLKNSIIKILIKAGANVNGKDINGCTPLCHQIKSKNTKLLIELGANVNARDNLEKTPLHYANERKEFEVLLKNGADVNAQDKNGYTPLHKEIEVDNIRVLLENGADIHLKNEHGQEPLHCILINLNDNPEMQEVKDLFFVFQALLDKDDLNQSIPLAKHPHSQSQKIKPLRL